MSNPTEVVYTQLLHSGRSVTVTVIDDPVIPDYIPVIPEYGTSKLLDYYRTVWLPKRRLEAINDASEQQTTTDRTDLG